MNTYEGELLNKKFDPEVEVNFGTSKQKCIHVYVQKKKKELKYSIKRNYRNERIKIHTDNDITTP